MRNYQKKKNNPYLLPKNLYAECKYLIKDYDRLKEEYTRLTNCDDEERNFALLCTVAAKISAVETALDLIPEVYRDGVFNNLINERTKSGYYPINADFRTYQNYKQRFIYFVAKNMNYV